MRSKEGGVMSIKEMEEAGIPMPEYEQTEIDTGGRRIPVVKQTSESDEGTYDPQTKEIIRFHRQNPEQLRKAA